MEHVRVTFFFACVLIFAPFLAFARADSYEFDPQLSNFTGNSIFADNLNRLVSSISSLTPKAYGFYNLSSGGSTGEAAYAIGLCRREVKRDDCLKCIQKAARNLTEQYTPQTKQAVVWYTHCMFRYSNRIIYGIKETRPMTAFIAGVEIPSNRVDFKRLQKELLNTLKGIAAAGGANRKYAQGNGSASVGYKRFYGSAQCTPDLSEQDCNDCLVYGFTRCCDDQIGLRWFCPSCNFRFETWRFYELEADLEPDPPAIQPAVSPKGKGKGGSKVVITIVISVVLIFLCAIFLCLVTKWRNREIEDRVKVGISPCLGLNAEDEFSNTVSLLVDFETLKTATDNFSEENELGRGGFGSVYKGVLSDGKEIAVKRLSGTSGQGDTEFKNEILLLAKLKHRNLVKLLGFCIQGLERLLVYEFIKNASLDQFIFDSEKRQALDWGVRYKMIEGVARGLLYLHEDSRYRIIHRDLKAGNILLDHEMNPKIADFGLAKLFDTAQTMTHQVTNRISGTYGYMAPEYAMHGHFSVKTDVYSFGVLVIEIVTGKGNNKGGVTNDEYAETLLSWVWRSWREDIILRVIDPSLTTGSRNEILRCLHIGLLCVQESPSIRPTMDSVALMLNSYSFTLPTPSRPAFVPECVAPLNVLQMSSNDVSISEFSPR